MTRETSNIVAAAIVGAAVVVAVLVYCLSNRYTVVRVHHDFSAAYLVNKITGSVKLLSGHAMYDVKPKDE